jgi:hypothetical protein
VTLTDVGVSHDISEEQTRQASNVAMASILNLTFLPGFAFLWLLFKIRKLDSQGLARYHLLFSIKLNLLALVCLVAVTGLMIVFGGFNSPWTWVFVITYFTFAHTVFIVLAMWALTRAWAGKRIRGE